MGSEMDKLVFGHTGSLSVVVGLVLVFRNGTSYDRWYEGRKLWADASATVESLARLIWVNVDTEKEAERGKGEKVGIWLLGCGQARVEG